MGAGEEAQGGWREEAHIGHGATVPPAAHSLRATAQRMWRAAQQHAPSQFRWRCWLRAEWTSCATAGRRSARRRSPCTPGTRRRLRGEGKRGAGRVEGRRRGGVAGRHGVLRCLQPILETQAWARKARGDPGEEARREGWGFEAGAGRQLAGQTEKAGSRQRGTPCRHWGDPPGASRPPPSQPPLDGDLPNHRQAGSTHSRSGRPLLRGRRERASPSSRRRAAGGVGGVGGWGGCRCRMDAGRRRLNINRRS